MLILASASPRRHELLTAAGIPHVVRPSAISEERRPGETPENFVRRLASEKAQAVERRHHDVVLGADTVVCVDDQILCKPSDNFEAEAMLRILSGREHTVLTGISLIGPNKTISDSAQTRVFFVQLTDTEIAEYTRSGEPYDKAGAYGIQGLASKFVWKIEGCYQNVVGLPVSLVYSHLKSL